MTPAIPNGAPERNTGQPAETERALPVRAVRRTYSSAHYLWSAKHSAELAAAEEAVKSNVPRFSVRHRSYVINGITAAVAFAEAAINEVFQDAADSYGNYLSALAPDALKALGHLWRATNEGQKYIGVLDKYDLALILAGQPPMNRGANPYADMASLVALRNWLIHSRPETVSSDDESSKLGARLAGKFQPNALMSSAGNPYFPDHALGAGCAEWAHRSALGYADRFTSCLGITLNYQLADFSSEPTGAIRDGEGEPQLSRE